MAGWGCLVAGKQELKNSTSNSDCKKPLSQDSHSDLNVLDFKGQIEVKVGKKKKVL